MNLEQSLQDAIMCHQAGRFQEAEQLYRSILQVNSKYPYANHNLGLLMVQKEQPEMALPLFLVAVESNPDSSHFWVSYIDTLIHLGQLEVAKKILNQGRSHGLTGEAFDQLEALLESQDKKSQTHLTQEQVDSVIALYSSGQIKKTLEACDLLVAQYPNEALFYNISGACYTDSGQLEMAVKHFEQALVINPHYVEAHYNLGCVLQNLGHFKASVSHYQQALEINPDYAEAHYNLGKVLKETGQLEAAVNSFKRVLKINPDYVVAHYNLGNTLMALSQPNEAITSYKRALEIKPDYAEAHNNLGNAFRDLDQLEAAVNSFEQALAIKPDYADAHNNLGSTLKGLGQLEAAVNRFEKALAIKPDYTEPYNNLGVTLHHLGQLEEALNCYEQALAIKPDYAEAHNNLGATLKDLGQLEAAVENFEQSLTIKSDYAEAHNNLGATLKDLEQLVESCKSLERALEIKPDYAEAHNNLGATLHELGQFDAAIRSYQSALAIKPDYVEVYSNLGVAFKDFGQPDTAIEYFTRALAMNPDYVEARYNLSIVQLDNGYLHEGFKNYEVRWKSDKFHSTLRHLNIPQWMGESLIGKNILIWGEQGVGDEIQFSTLIPEFRNIAANVVIECAPKVVAILQRSFPWVEVQKTGAINGEENEIYSQLNYQIPMGSLAPYFRKTIDDFHKKQKPFIPRFKQKEQKIRADLNLRDGELLIGLCWRSTLTTIRRKRTIGYLDIEDLAPFQIIKRARFLAVQYDDCQSELNRVRSKGLPVHYDATVDQKNDLLNTCALLGACDIVISASTAVYQLSGSLGVPTLCFRALNNEDKRIPWHPTVQYLNLDPKKPALLVQQIITELPEFIAWANKVTTSERRILHY